MPVTLRYIPEKSPLVVLDVRLARATCREARVGYSGGFRATVGNHTLVLARGLSTKKNNCEL